MNQMFKILVIFLILAAVSLSGCIGEDVPADEEVDVVIVDEPADVVEDPAADEPADVVEVIDPVKDAPEVPAVSKPSSSDNLVAGVDGQPGHGAEIKAKREAAEAARLAMLNALADSLPDAINASENASSYALAAEDIYKGARDRMNTSLESEGILNAANLTTVSTFGNITFTESEYDVLKQVKINARDALDAYDSSLEEDNSTAIYDALNATFVNAKAEFIVVRDIQDAYDDAVEAEETAQSTYDNTVDALAGLTVDSLEDLRIAAEDARTTADESLAYMEECQAAYDELNPVEEPEE